MFLILFFNTENFITFFIGIILGTIIVDIDSKKSRVGRHYIFRPLQFFIKHRGIMHTLIIAILLTLIISIFDIYFAFAFFIGYAGHLFLDALTVNGIMLFYPLTKKKIKFKITTNGIFEKIFFIILLITNILLTYFFIIKLL